VQVLEVVLAGSADGDRCHRTGEFINRTLLEKTV